MSRRTEQARRTPASRRTPPPSRGALPALAGLPGRALLIGGGVVVLLLVLLLARGCGDDSLSAQELRAQATAICARVNEATDRIAVPNAPAGGERFLAEGVALMRPALTRLQRLKPPQELRRQYELAVSANARQLQVIEQSLAEIRNGTDPIDAYRTLQNRLGLVSSTANSTWRALKIPACVSR